MLLRVTVRSFGINVLLNLVLHPFLPIAFFVPMGVGFATGWDIRARPSDGVAIGVLMGLFMLLLVCVVGTGFLLLVDAARFWWIVLAIASLAVAHVALFSGFGAALGGHLSRREDAVQAEAAPALSVAECARAPGGSGGSLPLRVERDLDRLLVDQ